MPLEYRFVTDQNELSVLLGKSSQFRHLNFKYDETILNFLKQHLNEAQSFYLIVREHGNFVAFCSMDKDWREKDVFFLREIFVEPSHQNQGIGKELLQRCIDHARAHKAKAIVTQADFANEPMQKLCHSFGFVEWANPEWKNGITYRLQF